MGDRAGDDDEIEGEALVGAAPRIVGRYAVYGEIASGGMATVHIGRLLGAAGFARTVAIKRLHPQYARDPEFTAMFVQEGRIAARLRHPNVVSTLDVIALKDELFLVLEFVLGESFVHLLDEARRRKARLPLPVLVGILDGLLEGLHYAHEAKADKGEPLNLVHRDVSPHNVLVGEDGVARILDFGIAKASGSALNTGDGIIKGKIAYMAPEQLLGLPVDRRADVYAAALMAWEGLAGRRVADGLSTDEIVGRRLNGVIEPPSKYEPMIPPELDAVVLKGLAREPHERYATARDFALAVRAAQVVEVESDGRVRTRPGATPDELRLTLSEHVKREATNATGSYPASDASPGGPDDTAQAPERSGGSGAHSPGGQDTGVTASRAIGLQAPAPWSQLAIAAVALAIALVVATSLLVTRRPGETANAASPPSAPVVLPLLPAAVSSPAPAAPPLASAAPPSAPAPAPSAVGDLPAAPKPRVGVAGRPAVPARPPRAVCDPPFVVDDRGIRRLKPECL